MPAFAHGGDAVTAARLTIVSALALALALAVSCGGSGKVMYEGQPTKLTRPQPEPLPATDEARHARIETLDREIADRAATLGFEPLPGTNPRPGTNPWSGTGTNPRPSTNPDPGTSTMAEPPGVADSCPRSSRPVCQDVCTLSDSICDAADEICRIAASMPGDDWAAGRCSAGATSCAQARTRCCDC